MYFIAKEFGLSPREVERWSVAQIRETSFFLKYYIDKTTPSGTGIKPGTKVFR